MIDGTVPPLANDLVPRQRPLGLALAPLGLVFFAVGIATAVVGPFLSLFLSTAVHADPLRVTVFLTVAPLAGVVIGTLIGRLSDRWPIRRQVLIGAAVAGMVGMGLTAVVREYWILLGLAVTATAVAGSLFPQTFAYARQVLARHDASRAAMGISSLRTVFSLAWVAGPPLAAVLLASGGFRYLYLMAAIMYGVAALLAVGWLAEPPTLTAPTDDANTNSTNNTNSTDRLTVSGHRDAGGDGAAPAAPRRTLLLTAAAFTMLQCPLTLGVQALPLFIDANLGGDAANAGIMFGLCAALEIPLMLGLGALTTRLPLRRLILIGASCGVGYNVLVTASSTVWMLAVGQLLNAMFIAAVSGLGISYMQDMLPNRPGQATTLFTNSFPIGAMLAGPLFGLAQHVDFRLAYGMGTALCAAGLVVLLLTRPPGRRVAG